MKKLSITSILACMSLYINSFGAVLNEPDSAYLFGYSTTKNSGHNGLHFAWSIDLTNWHSIGPEYRFLFCDYGRWGSQKRMLTPFVFQDKSGLWHCVWSVNEQDGTFAHASSKDLVNCPLIRPKDFIPSHG